MDKGITVAELFIMLKKQIEKGNKDKYILISDDDEGNGYHTLFYGVDDDPEMIKYALSIEHDRHEANEIVILG